MKSLNEVVEINEGSAKMTKIFVVLGIGDTNSWPAQNCRIFVVDVPNSVMKALDKKKGTFFANVNGVSNDKHLTDREQKMLDKLLETMSSHIGSEYQRHSKTILGWCEANMKGGKSDWASGPTPIEVNFSGRF